MIKPRSYRLKSTFDIFLLVIMILPVHVVMGVIVLLYAFQRQSQIIFKQKRTGLYGGSFYIYKFRTLNSDLETTRIGRALRLWSLDELPQIWNILKGEMSFVGPRPLLPEYLNRYSKQQEQRMQVKPGITGLAQVNGRNSITWDQKFEHDVYYVENSSLKMDLKIIFKTLISLRSEIVDPNLVRPFDPC